MISIIMVSHGPLARSMVESAEMVAGKQEDIYVLELHEGETPEKFKEQVKSVLLSAMEYGQVVLLSDFVLSTPFNVVTELMALHSFHHITGMNMPLLLSLLKARESQDDGEFICKEALKIGKLQMMNINDFVKELEI